MRKIIVLGIIGMFLLSFSGAGTSPEVGAVARLVEDFGRSLKSVPLQAPAEVVEESMRQHYGEYVIPELLEEWILCPLKAPGRAVSSPWPDRIEVETIREISSVTYEVDGDIVEVTNIGEAARRAVTLVVVKKGEVWRIRSVLLLPPGQIRELWGGEDIMENLSLTWHLSQPFPSPHCAWTSSGLYWS